MKDFVSLLLCLLSLRFAKAERYTNHCRIADDCSYTTEESCPSLLAENHFTGTCCSLADNSNGGCTVSVSSGVCYWQTFGGDGSVLLSSGQGAPCPASDYDPFVEDDESDGEGEPSQISVDTKDEDDGGSAGSVGEGFDESIVKTRKTWALLPFNVTVKDNEAGHPTDLGFHLKSAILHLLNSKLSFEAMQEVALHQVVLPLDKNMFYFHGHAVFEGEEKALPTNEKVQARQRHVLRDTETQLSDALQGQNIKTEVIAIEFEGTQKALVNQQPDEKKSGFPIWVWIIIGGLFVVVILFSGIYLKKKNRELLRGSPIKLRDDVSTASDNSTAMVNQVLGITAGSSFKLGIDSNDTMKNEIPSDTTAYDGEPKEQEQLDSSESEPTAPVVSSPSKDSTIFGGISFDSLV